MRATTATTTPAAERALGLCRQLLVVILIHVPTISLGLAMGWVSLVSGEHGQHTEAPGEDRAAGARVVVAAATTFLASLVGVPLSASALRLGRRFATIATSVCFVVCWSLKLSGGGWWVVAARVFAGLGGAGAYSVPPLLAREMCEKRVRGAAASALILAHNVGFLLMYVAADQRIAHRTVLWWCLGLSVAHCGAFLLVPESPAFLAANKRDEASNEAVSSLAWLRGVAAGHPSLTAELAALPAPDLAPQNILAVFKEMVREPARRRAFVISFIAIVGQEACGVYTLMQFAERTFVLARDSNLATDAFGNTTWALSNGLGNRTDVVSNMVPTHAEGQLLSPARLAVILGVVQLITSAVALYLVEKVGRRRLLVWSGVVTGACLAGGAGAAWGGARVWAAAALAAAVAADSGGLQPAPYALLADMFPYQYRSTALMVSSAVACIGNAVEVAVFPALADAGGLPPTLAVAAALTAAYTLYAFIAIPETRGLTPEQIYEKLARPGDESRKTKELEMSGRV